MFKKKKKVIPSESACEERQLCFFGGTCKSCRVMPLHLLSLGKFNKREEGKVKRVDGSWWWVPVIRATWF